jgi:hypothetical protein
MLTNKTKLPNLLGICHKEMVSLKNKITILPFQRVMISLNTPSYTGEYEIYQVNVHANAQA